MTKIDAKFLRQVQGSGWHVEAVGQDHCIGKCPAHGCGMRAKLMQGATIPPIDPTRERNRLDYPVGDFEEMRNLLRRRRVELALSIHEVEEVAGIAVDFLAKFEKDNPSKLPNIQTALEWVQALGFEVVLRPASMSTLGLRTICDTRDKLETRRKRFKHDERQRQDRRDA